MDLLKYSAVYLSTHRYRKGTPGSKFFGVNEDVKYLAEWINTFVTRKNRWASPKFLIGESYGTTRAAGIAGYLADRGIAFNGITLLSIALSYRYLPIYER